MQTVLIKESTLKMIKKYTVLLPIFLNEFLKDSMMAKSMTLQQNTVQQIYLTPVDLFKNLNSRQLFLFGLIHMRFMSQVRRKITNDYTFQSIS